MPANPDTSWWNATLWKTDPLYKEIAFGTSGMQFFLGHHTFTHENMNNVTYNDAYQQIRLNQVQLLLPAYVSLRCSSSGGPSQNRVLKGRVPEEICHRPKSLHGCALGSHATPGRPDT
jgi:hypothetical protein